LPPRAGVRVRHCRQERLGVRVLRLREDLLLLSNLNDLADVNDQNPITKILDHAQVVGNEGVG
jgi:hypothetical protein